MLRVSVVFCVEKTHRTEGSFNQFLLSRNVASGQGCILYAPDLWTYLGILCAYQEYSDIRNLDDMGVHVVNGILIVSQCLARTEPLRYTDAYGAYGMNAELSVATN